MSTNLASRSLVFFPTYNEAGNVEVLLGGIREHLPDADVLTVDDASPDGTGALLDRLAADDPRLTVIHRPGKLGVGSAHKLAMLHARRLGYGALITMDADLSHHPRYLPEFPRLLADADFVTGSRYMPGGTSDYGPLRTLISRTANTSARMALGFGLHENTTLFRGFSLDLLRRLDIDAIRSEGYSFAVESIFEISKVTTRMTEFPIHFENRLAGASKISRYEIYRGIWTIQRLAAKRLLSAGGRPTGSEAGSGRVACRACSSPYNVEIHPERVDAGGASLADASPYSCATHSGRSHGAILKCLQCGLVFMRPKLDDSALVDEYAAAEDPVYLANLHARETTFRYNLHRVRGYFREGDRVLEVGSYCGAFLKVARDQGLDVVGLEPSRWAVEASTSVTDAKVVCGTLDDLPEGEEPFDVIVAWDVLEHLADPVEELRKMHRRLAPRGTLLFSTLMIDNWFPRLMGARWPWLMDMHLYYFTEATVRSVLERAGFQVIDDDKYCHVVTLGYLVQKLGTLGVPGARAVGERIAEAPWARVEIPFRFGDIKLFACRKVPAEEAPSSARVLRASASGR